VNWFDVGDADLDVVAVLHRVVQVGQVEPEVLLYLVLSLVQVSASPSTVPVVRDQTAAAAGAG
jgi:hypothetical protein